MPVVPEGTWLVNRAHMSSHRGSVEARMSFQEIALMSARLGLSEIRGAASIYIFQGSGMPAPR